MIKSFQKEVVNSERETTTFVERIEYVWPRPSEGVVYDFVVLVHGLGDSCELWKSSKVAKAIVSSSVEGRQQCVVIAYDIFAHGQSSACRQLLDGQTDVLEVITQQLLDVLSDDSVFEIPPGAVRGTVNLHGFSMGGLVAINYFSRNFHRQRPIRRLLLQSPWDGSMPAWGSFLLSYVPFVGHIARMLEFKHCHNADYLHAYLFLAGQTDSWDSKIQNFVTNIFHQVGSDQSDQITDKPPLDILLLCGTHESMFFESCRCIFNLVQQQQQQEQQEQAASESRNSETPTIAASSEAASIGQTEPRQQAQSAVSIQWRVCQNASHMTFDSDVNGDIGKWFRTNIKEFFSFAIEEGN